MAGSPTQHVNLGPVMAIQRYITANTVNSVNNLYSRWFTGNAGLEKILWGQHISWKRVLQINKLYLKKRSALSNFYLNSPPSATKMHYFPPQYSILFFGQFNDFTFMYSMKKIFMDYWVFTSMIIIIKCRKENQQTLPTYSSKWGRQFFTDWIM